ncbi:TlpA family protein disulfide reductase [Lysobacter sp. HDW10]|uniref:TlpA family protein disulfide reductase n=1 Tax=Lysobacter sp. HDW10 TaxID=2714936 RepID=UPI00140AD835|nr:TlpA disulfide reductase family protein [Lysobacter sp. HDW10]QIK80514.1 TlpA family protein disulfide reductase [Lysobacter sp. HDW10]
MTSPWRTYLKIVLAAFAGALIALLAAVLVDPKPWLLESTLGHKWLQAFLDWRAPVAPGTRRVREGDTVQSLALTTLEGQSTGLRAHLGPDYTVVNLWATWCGPCLKEMPALEAFARQQRNAKLIAIGMDEPDAVAQFLSRNPSKIPQLLAAAPPAFSPGELGNPAGVLPYSVLLDAKGTVIARRTGLFHSADDIRTWVATATR